MSKSEKLWYIHYLFDLLNNPTKFQLNWKRTQNSQLKLFDTAVTLKYGPGHWNWYEQITLNEQYNYAKFGIYGMQVNTNVKVFDKFWHLTNKKHV